jgi:hypothetical protein
MVDALLVSMMENLYWWGIPIIFICLHQEATNQYISLRGVPQSTGNGTTERDQYLWPMVPPNVSSVGRLMQGEFPFKSLGIC